MANSITLVKQFVKMLDEAYKLASLTSDLDGASELVRQGANANELIIPKLSMSGLGDYSRNGGYVAGDVTLTNETVKCNFDRGRLFTVDALDNQESAYTLLADSQENSSEQRLFRNLMHSVLQHIPALLAYPKFRRARRFLMAPP